MMKLVRTRRVKGLTGRLEKTDVQRFFRYTVYIYSLLCGHILFTRDHLLSCDDTYSTVTFLLYT